MSSLSASQRKSVPSPGRAYTASPSPPVLSSTSSPPPRKWSIDDAHTSRLYSPASPALYGVDMRSAAQGPRTPASLSASAKGSYACDDEHAYAYRYSLFDDYAEADDDLYAHAPVPVPVASSSKLLLHQSPLPVSGSAEDQHRDLEDAPFGYGYEYDCEYEYGVGRGRREFAEKRERRRGGVCEWDFALLEHEHEHEHIEQSLVDATVPDWSPLSDLSLASTDTSTGFGSLSVHPEPGPSTSTGHPDSPSRALRKARTAIGNTDAEEMARAMIGLGLARPSYRPAVDHEHERDRESWRELGFAGGERETQAAEESVGGSGSGWMWATESLKDEYAAGGQSEALGLLERDMSFMDTGEDGGTDADVVSHLDLDFEDEDEDEDEVVDLEGGGERVGGCEGAYTQVLLEEEEDSSLAESDAGLNKLPQVDPPSSPPPSRLQSSQSHTHTQHLSVPTQSQLQSQSPSHPQLLLPGTRASALVDWAALALDTALREDPGRCWAAVCFGDVFPPPPTGSVGVGAHDTDAWEQAELSVGTGGRERELLAFSHALASPEMESDLEMRDVEPGSSARPEAEVSARRELEPEHTVPAQNTRGRSQRRRNLPPTPPPPPPPLQTQTRTRPRIVTTTTTLTPTPATVPTVTSPPAAQTRPRGRTRERTPVDPVLCATPATTPPSSALALVSVSPAGLGAGMDPADVPPVPPLPPIASHVPVLPSSANPAVQDDGMVPPPAPRLAPVSTPAPAPASSAGVPVLRLDTSWSANSIPLPSVGRRVIGSEGDIFSHTSQPPHDPHVRSQTDGGTTADTDADAQEVPLRMRSDHEDAIFAALLTPTAPLSLSPTRPPAPRYRPLSDPPPYTAAVSGSDTHARGQGLAHGVSPAGSPGADAEVQQPYHLPPSLDPSPDPDSKASLRALVQRQERERAQGMRTARELPPVPVLVAVRPESPARSADGAVDDGGLIQINNSVSAEEGQGEVEAAMEPGGTVLSDHDSPSLLELDHDSEDGQGDEGEQSLRCKPKNWRAYTSCPDLSLDVGYEGEGGRASEGENQSCEGDEPEIASFEPASSVSQDMVSPMGGCVEDREQHDTDERGDEGERDRPFSPFSHISAEAAIRAEGTSTRFIHHPSPAASSAHDSPSTSYMHVQVVNRDASGSGPASAFTPTVTPKSSSDASPRSAHSGSGSGSGSGWHASASASASNVSLIGTSASASFSPSRPFAPPPPLPAFSTSRPSSPFHKNAIPSAKALSTLGIAPPSGPGPAFALASSFIPHPAAQNAQTLRTTTPTTTTTTTAPTAPRATQMTFETTYLPNFSVPRPGEGIGYTPKHPSSLAKAKAKGQPAGKHKHKAKSLGRSAHSRLAGHHAKAAKSVDMASEFGGMWSDPLEAAAAAEGRLGVGVGGVGVSRESDSAGGAFQRFAGALSRRFATVSIGSGR